MDKPVSHIELTNEIKSLIETTKQKVAQSINSSLTLLYWSIGHMLNNSLKKEYGEEIVATVSQQLHTFSHVEPLDNKRCFLVVGVVPQALPSVVP